MSTVKGRELATRLVRHYLPWPTPADTDFAELDETCSLLLRHGTTYNRHEEALASDSRFADERLVAAMERRQEALERRMGELLRRLPPPQDGYAWRLRFDGLYASLEAFEPGESAHSAARSIPLSNY